MLLLLVLAVKKREVSGLSFLRRMRKEDRRNGIKVQWNPQRLNPKGTYVGSGTENVDNGKKEMMPTLEFSFGRFFFKKEASCRVFSIRKIILKF